MVRLHRILIQLRTPRVDFEAEPAYLATAGERLREVLGTRLVGAYVGGSYALGDFLPDRSDLDLAAVVRASLSRGLAEALVAALRHEALPCPARCLELVVYRLDTARSGSASPDFELNLNTGADLPLSVQLRGEPGVASHWFAIDRSVLSQAGIALVGAPAGEVFASIPPSDLIPVLIESLEWHRNQATESSDAMLNACRALRFAVAGRWSSKPAAGRWAVELDLAPADLVSRAITARADGSALDPAEVADFLSAAEARLRRART
jgi:hypothetical protein